MPRPQYFLLLSALVATTVFAAAPAVSPDQPAVAADLAKLPLAFESNRGQAPADADFLARGAGYTILLRATGADLVLRARDRAEVIHLNLLNGSETHAAPSAPLATKVNYLRGNDPKRWVTNLPTYEQVRFAGVYPATNLVYYGNQGKLEYDFNVAPGGDPGRIGFDVSGVDHVRLLANGDLSLEAKGGSVVWHKPVAYQLADGKRVPVAAHYRVAGKRVSFRVGPYDRDRVLVIDPALAYSTFFGGSADDTAMAVAVDTAGSAYVAGMTKSTNMPTTPGAFDTTCGSDGNCNNFDGALADGFVFKLDSTGTRLVYATYVGGNDFDEITSIAVDKNGNAYLGGETFSNDFFADFHLGAGQASRSYGVAFVLELRADGAGPIYGTTIGGANGSNGQAVTGIKVDGSGNAYITGITDASDFPTTAGAFQTTYGGAPSGTGGDAFVGELKSDGSALVWSSYLGGNMRDSAEDLALDSTGNVYVTGWTSSANFPVTAGAFQATLPSNPPSGFDPTSAFVTKVSAGGASLAYSTYLGGTKFVDEAYGIAVANGNAYVTGTAQSSNFPTTTGAIKRTLQGLSDSFVTKLNTTGTALVYSTLLGGTSDERGSGIAVNSSGIAYATGVTYSSDFPVNSNGFQQVYGGNEDVYVTQLNASGTGFAFSSFLGGSNFEEDQDRPRITLLGSSAFVVGSTASSDFPITPDAPQKTLAGSTDAFAARVVPLCAVNQTNLTVTLCKPAAGATVTSPVEIMAGTWDSRKVKVIQVFVDGTKKYQAPLASLDIRLPMTTGSHRVTVQAIDTANAVFKASHTITVGPSTTPNCQSNGTPGSITICQPRSPATNPVEVLAALQPRATPTTVIQVYVDGVKKYETTAVSSLPRNSQGDIILDTHLTIATGTHRFTVQGLDSAGRYAMTIYQIQVQ